MLLMEDPVSKIGHPLLPANIDQAHYQYDQYILVQLQIHNFIQEIEGCAEP